MVGGLLITILMAFFSWWRRLKTQWGHNLSEVVFQSFHNYLKFWGCRNYFIGNSFFEQIWSEVWKRGFQLIQFLGRLGKVHIFWEGHKILRNIHLTFRKILWPSQNIWTLCVLMLWAVRYGLSVSLLNNFKHLPVIFTSTFNS